MAELVHPPQAIALERGAHQTDQQGGNQQGGPEADGRSDGIGKVGAQHVEGLAWAKLSTPIMLKISVSPELSMNSSKP